MKPATVFAALIPALVLVLPAQAEAGPNTIEQLYAIDTGKARLVLASSPAGMVIFNDALEVYRIYRYGLLGKKPTARLMVVDLDGDGRPEIIGIGKPTFGLDATGNPLWDFPDGCSELAVGDLLGTPEKEVACIHGKSLTVLACDGSPSWEVQLSSTGMSGLAAGLLGTTDGKDGLEFNVGKEILRFKGDGTPLGNEFTERATTPVDLLELQRAESAGLLDGSTQLDLDGDGVAEDSLLAEGSKLSLRFKGKQEPVVYELPGGRILAVAVGEGFGDTPLIVVGGEGRVAFLGADGKVKKETAIDLLRASRSPKVEVVGVNAVGFELRENVGKTFDASREQVAACYEKRHKAYGLTRQGKTMFKFDVSDKGKVTAFETLYTTLNDSEVNGCIGRIVKGLTFPKPSEPGAHFTADLLFTWTDRF